MDLGDEKEELICSNCDCEEMDLIAYLNERRKRLRAASMINQYGQVQADEADQMTHMRMILTDQLMMQENLDAKTKMEDAFVKDIIAEENTYDALAYEMELFEFFGKIIPDWEIPRYVRLRETEKFRRIMKDLQREGDEECEDDTMNQVELLTYLNEEEDFIQDFEDAGTCLMGCNRTPAYYLRGCCDECLHEEAQKIEDDLIDEEIHNMMVKRDLMSRYGTVEGGLPVPHVGERVLDGR